MASGWCPTEDGEAVAGVVKEVGPPNRAFYRPGDGLVQVGLLFTGGRLPVLSLSFSF